MPTATEATSPVEDARRALVEVGEDPRRAYDDAAAVLVRLPRPRSEEEVRAVVTARRATAQALRNLGRTTDGLVEVRRGISTAERLGYPSLAAEGRMTLSFLLLEVGRLRAALATIDQALGSLDGLEAAKARTNRALILHRSGRHREAMDEYAAALPVIRRAKDGRSERLLRGNRAQLSAEQGDIASAVADMEWSRRYALEQGRTIDAADDLWNLAALHALAGDLPRALELFDRADAEWGDVDRPQRFTARAEVLLEAGLAADAAELASDGIRWAQAHGWMYAEAEARLWLALASLTLPSPDLVRAEQEARAAVTAFAHQGRPDWQVLAQHAELVVRIRRSGRPADLDRAVEVASLLRDRGRDAHAADLRVAAGRRALAQGDIARARTMLGPLANQSTSRQIEVRSRAWYARALLQTIGSEAGASASLVRAWRLAEEQTALRGATELRAASASHASDIVATGCGLAVRERNVLRAFAWAERGRSSSLRRPVVRAPQDPELASALARLRWSAMLDENALQDGDVDLAIRARRRRDEAEVRRLSLRARGGGRAERVATVTDIRRCAEHRALVELLQHDARYWAVRVDASGAELLPLAPVGEIGQHVDTLVFALRRLLATPPGPGRDRMRGTLDSAREQLRTLVIEPLGTAEGTALVVSPVGHLCQLPWGALDQCCGGITVAPSATTWFRAQSEPAPSSRQVLAVAGPGLEGAADEVARVASSYADGTALTGPDATVEATLAALTGVTTLHVAAHGRLRRDNPLFSSLLLSDGPLTLYDLEALPSVPAEVVLSACSSGGGHAVVGDEVLGMAWTLLAGGARTVLAPALPVPDAQTAAVMTRLHEHLARGDEPGGAWRRTTDELRGDDELAAVAAAFTHYGV